MQLSYLVLTAKTIARHVILWYNQWHGRARRVYLHSSRNEKSKWDPLAVVCIVIYWIL